MTKEQAINKISNTPHVYLNDDQKKIAIGIINSVPKGEDVLSYFDFVMKRADVGFKFDVSPEIAIGRIAVVNEMEVHNINTDSDNIDVNENKLIIGDNYEALKNLLLTHKEQIDVIYIDPPYNTETSKDDGNASSKEGNSSKFIYKDKFGRNGWLNMIRNRLVLARRLLSPNGVIFVSIDDSEQAYLKVLMDDIFGEGNFVNQLVWVSNKKGRQISNSAFAKTYEYIIMYSKNVDVEFTDSMIDRKYAEKIMPIIYEPKNLEIQKDDKGEYITQNELHNTNINGFNIKTRLNLFYPIYTNGKEITIKERKGYKKLLPPKNGEGVQGVWRWSKEKVERESDDLKVVRYKDTFKIFTKVRNITYSPKNIIFSPKLTTKSGGSELKNLGLTEFSFPKPSSLIKFLLTFVSKKESNVLDFFAGSGTTGHAVMELNKEDDGNRKFILVTNNENNIGLDITYERLYRIINGKSTSNEKDFKWLEKNVPFSKEKLRVFNIKHFDVEIDQSKELDNITNIAVKNLKKLNPLYNDKDALQVYFDLDGLNPINEAQKEQVYSTDPINHRISKNVNDFNKSYCTCGKSFIKIEDLKKHIEKENI